MSDKKKIKEADEGRVTTKASVLTDELMDKATGGNGKPTLVRVRKDQFRSDRCEG
ncbi:MAG: hypothetical protein ACSW73_01125 [Spirochaetales bacterium]